MSRIEALLTMPVLLLAPPIPSAEPGSLHPMRVLIRVPHARANATPRPHSASWPARSQRTREVKRTRRRLRRHVRLTGLAVLALLPSLLTWSHLTAAGAFRHPGFRLLSLPSQRSGGDPLCSEFHAEARTYKSLPATTPAPILLSIEPAGTAGESDAEAPVVFPGYLLPDDHHEEPVHEGS